MVVCTKSSKISGEAWPAKTKFRVSFPLLSHYTLGSLQQMLGVQPEKVHSNIRDCCVNPDLDAMGTYGLGPCYNALGQLP